MTTVRNIWWRFCQWLDTEQGSINAKFCELREHWEHWLVVDATEEEKRALDQITRAEIVDYVEWIKEGEWMINDRQSLPEHWRICADDSFGQLILLQMAWVRPFEKRSEWLEAEALKYAIQVNGMLIDEEHEKTLLSPFVVLLLPCGGQPASRFLGTHLYLCETQLAAVNAAVENQLSGAGFYMLLFKAALRTWQTQSRLSKVFVCMGWVYLLGLWVTLCTVSRLDYRWVGMLSWSVLFIACVLTLRIARCWIIEVLDNRRKRGVYGTSQVAIFGPWAHSLQHMFIKGPSFGLSLSVGILLALEQKVAKRGKSGAYIWKMIYRAFVGKGKCLETLVFTGRMATDGRIEGVDGIEHKRKAASDQGLVLVTPKANTDQRENVLRYGNLRDLFLGEAGIRSASATALSCVAIVAWLVTCLHFEALKNIVWAPQEPQFVYAKCRERIVTIEEEPTLYYRVQLAEPNPRSVFLRVMDSRANASWDIPFTADPQSPGEVFADILLKSVNDYGLLEAAVVRRTQLFTQTHDAIVYLVPLEALRNL